MALLEVDQLITEFATDEGLVRAVDGVSFEVEAGATLGIVGESGCGKSVTALSMMRLLPQPMGRIAGGSITFQGTDLTRLDIPAMEKVRGRRIGMVFQEPMTALNPVQTIGHQVAETIRIHDKTVSRHAAARQAAEALERVGLPNDRFPLSRYPHELSGGMRQRVVIAMALACEPDLLIADEPTTALDVTIQAQILELIADLQRRMGMAVIMITHDLGVIAETCEQVVVMYAGKVAEQGSVFDIFDRPAHPYTRGLLASIPRLETPAKSRLGVIEGMVPGLRDLPIGCRFENRCEHAIDRCREQVPAPELVAPGHTVSCLRWQAL
ncbi:MAG TPA: peptide ABC transporter ATP-binding protein [Halieaceae bacterium]|nr:peptide ABC transporter ATP-binding protein [Halieaceae bacterium]